MARKGENIYKQKDGRWEGRYISSYDHAGKAKYSYVYAKSYSEVKQKLNSVKAGIINSNTVKNKPDPRTFAMFSMEWLNEKRFAIKTSTFIRYQNTLANHILPKFGNYQLGKVECDRSIILRQK